MPRKPPVAREPVSLDRFFLLKGIPAGFALLMLSIPYGMTTTYVAMYAKQIGINQGTGLFFTMMAAGTALSRIFSGRQVDKGNIIRVILTGMCMVGSGFFLLASCQSVIHYHPATGTFLFFGVAFLLGTGFGTMFPAFNTLFVNLAPNSKRGTATSTYLTSWDVGIGIGLTAGGYISDRTGLSTAYLIGGLLTLISILFFRFVVGPHFIRNRMR